MMGFMWAVCSTVLFFGMTIEKRLCFLGKLIQLFISILLGPVGLIIFIYYLYKIKPNLD